MASASTRSGGCRCGAVRFRAEGEPLWVGHCHCSDCRGVTASPFTTYAGYRSDQVAFTKTSPKTFTSSPGATRGFCGACGTPISFTGERWPGETHLFVCTFDEPQGLKPALHVQVAQQLPWLHLGDTLPRFERFPPNE